MYTKCILVFTGSYVLVCIFLGCTISDANLHHIYALAQQDSTYMYCAAHIGMGGVKIKKEPRQRDEYVYRIS